MDFMEISVFDAGRRAEEPMKITIMSGKKQMSILSFAQRGKPPKKARLGPEKGEEETVQVEEEETVQVEEEEMVEETVEEMAGTKGRKVPATTTYNTSFTTVWHHVEQIITLKRAKIKRNAITDALHNTEESDTITTEDEIILTLTPETSTQADIEAQVSLPSTPRLIMLECCELHGSDYMEMLLHISMTKFIRKLCSRFMAPAALRGDVLDIPYKDPQHQLPGSLKYFLDVL
ncbi:hypothetical protein EYF80_035387 [Liparis tanakae]|uniref:Uncharacterized protein n=1 Tax=Liparis tanakae TaxID=230148 RepID=A0A4Z2GLE6_9TELE|nr:hypothetical protein EYF80_035387 [Liparis tanakae]